MKNSFYEASFPVGVVFYKSVMTFFDGVMKSLDVEVFLPDTEFYTW